MKKIIAYASTLLLALILAGCNLTNVFPTLDLSIGVLGPASNSGADGGDISEIVVGVGPGGQITLPFIRVRAQARPGSIGAFIEGYSVDYFQADGEQELPSNGQSYRGVLSLTVDDGVICRETRSAPEPIDCDINDYDPENPDRDFEYAYGDPAISDQFAPIDGEIAIALFDTEGSYASIVIEGRDANGNDFSQRLSPVKIVYRASSAGTPAPEQPEPQPEPEPEDPEDPEETDG